MWNKMCSFYFLLNISRLFLFLGFFRLGGGIIFYIVINENENKKLKTSSILDILTTIFINEIPCSSRYRYEKNRPGLLGEIDKYKLFLFIL